MYIGLNTICTCAGRITKEVSGVVLVNNSSDDVRGLVMKRLITYDDVFVLVIYSPMLQRAVDLRENTWQRLVSIKWQWRSDSITLNSGTLFLLTKVICWWKWTLWRMSHFRPYWAHWTRKCNLWRLQTSLYQTAIGYYETLRSHWSEHSHFFLSLIFGMTSLAVICLTEWLSDFSDASYYKLLLFSSPSYSSDTFFGKH